MKINHSFLLLLCLALLTYSGCDDDDTNIDNQANAELNYAGPNFTAPQINAGSNIFAAYFPSRITRQFEGQNLTAVDFFAFDIPEATRVLVYNAGSNDDSPGQLLYEADITNRVTERGPVSHRLRDPIEITGEGLWLGIETIILNNGEQSVGCDQGLNYSQDGDRLFVEEFNTWTSFQDITGERVNWNISGQVE